MNVLITGSSRGLGASMAKLFAKNGYNVIINYFKNEEAALKLKEITNGLIIKCDISNEEDVKAMFKQIDHLDILINNAGIANDKDPLLKSGAEFNHVLETNLTGTFLVTKYAIPKMSKGSIVNISSTNGIDTNYPESIDYDASKAGIISLTHNFADYLNDIRVNCICPDWMDTSMNEDMDPIYKEKIEFLNPDDVAKLVYEVAINESMDNQIIRVGDNSVR